MGPAFAGMTIGGLVIRCISLPAMTSRYGSITRRE